MSQERAQCHRVEPIIGGWAYLRREPRMVSEGDVKVTKRAEGVENNATSQSTSPVPEPKRIGSSLPKVSW